MNKLTAILFFTRSASCEADHKSFLRVSLNANKKIAANLIRNTLSVIKKTGLNYFIIDETKQSGDNFGERLVNAIELVLSEGYSQVIVVGNDCPQLTVTHIITAADKLQSYDFVFGPTGKGGFYLIGLNQTANYRELAAAVDWQTPAVQETVIRYIGFGASRFTLLPQLSDFNNETDYHFLRTRLAANSKLLKMLVAIFASLTSRHQPFVISFTPSSGMRITQLRAPPGLV